VTLLLSLWTPCDPEPQVNSYWVNRAFHHARTANLPDILRRDIASQPRSSLLWECCLIRDRMLALALRRPERLHEKPHSHFRLSLPDFGREAGVPSYTDRYSKYTLIIIFTYLSDLAKIMASVAIDLESVRYCHEWDTQNKAPTSKELDKIKVLDKMVLNWRTEFDQVVANRIQRSARSCGARKLIFFLRIISEYMLPSLSFRHKEQTVYWRLTVLYGLFSMHRTYSLLSRFLRTDNRFQWLRSGKAPSEWHAQRMNSYLNASWKLFHYHCKSRQNPSDTRCIYRTFLYRISWLAFPAAVICTSHPTQHKFAHQHDLMVLMARLATRFDVAWFVLCMLHHAIDKCVERDKDSDHVNATCSSLDAYMSPSHTIGISTVVGSADTRYERAEFLSWVARLLDNGLSNNMNRVMRWAR
jgi:hypothetical protein